MKLNIDWTKVESRYKYAAMDSNEKVYLYVDLPYPQGSIWYSSGNYKSLGYHATRVGESNWEETLTERPTEETEMSAQNNTHPHAAIIADAIKDTSHKIEWRDIERGGWVESSLGDVVNAPGAWEFRFSDTVKPTVIVTSPLTQRELQAVWEESGIPMSNGAVWDKLEQVGIAVKVATIKAVAAMTFDASSLKYRGGGYHEDIAGAAVSEFQAQLLKLIGE